MDPIYSTCSGGTRYDFSRLSPLLEAESPLSLIHYHRPFASYRWWTQPYTIQGRCAEGARPFGFALISKLSDYTYSSFLNRYPLSKPFPLSAPSDSANALLKGHVYPQVKPTFPTSCQLQGVRSNRVFADLLQSQRSGES
jgi:hypothetical protein